MAHGWGTQGRDLSDPPHLDALACWAAFLAA